MAGRRISVDGYSFRNEQAVRAYFGLKSLARAGRVSSLEINPTFELVVNDRSVGTYSPTFQFFDKTIQQERYVHVISTKAQTRSLRMQLFEVLYNVEVEEWL